MLTKSARSVLVVGAGPTGLAAALALRTKGVDVEIVDAAGEGANTSRAAVVHARTLEVLEPFGVSARILERAVKVPNFEVRDGTRTLARLSFAQLPTAYPFTAMIAQSETEALIRQRLAELGTQVSWAHTVEELEQSDDSVTVTVRDAGGTSTQHQVDAVVGADGMHSTVRGLVGIDFPGAGYAQSFLLADVKMAHARPRDTVSLNFAPAGLVVIAPLPDDHFRVVATYDTAPERPDRNFVQSLLDERAPGGQVTDVVWGARFRVHHRLASTYRAGRVFLAGDAAHVHSPAGGQGMNVGIQDALHLAEVLAAGDDLAAYESRRRPMAEQVVHPDRPDDARGHRSIACRPKAPQPFHPTRVRPTTSPAQARDGDLRARLPLAELDDDLKASDWCGVCDGPGGCPGWRC